MPSVGQYFHTIRHLRSCQITARLRRLFGARRVSAQISEAACRWPEGEWVTAPKISRSFVVADDLCFLNQSLRYQSALWETCEADRLWHYNLHYFDILQSDNPDEVAFGEHLITDWLSHVVPQHGTGWEPYPTSLRVVNWIKHWLAGGDLPEAALSSLYLQARSLAANIEYHLMGNHVFENAKALIFAGCFFAGREADRWFLLGSQLLQQEITAQILPDGGHFERSPMYHAIILLGLLDCYNLYQTYLLTIPYQWQHILAKMLIWLNLMTHPDGEVSFFNDAAMGVAPVYEALKAYADRLGIAVPGMIADGIHHMADTGYIRIQRCAAVCLMDVGEVGPTYIPGHAHADTLSLELSLYGKRVLVNAGTSTYHDPVLRAYQRSTAAHNTVAVADQNSSDVWGSHRVGLRAYPHPCEIQNEGDISTVACAHDGYVRRGLGVIHQRAIEMRVGMLHLEDFLQGKDLPGVGYLHLHPDVAISAIDAQHYELAIADRRIRLQANGETALSSETGHFYPEFNRAVPNQHLTYGLGVSQPASLILNW